MNVLIVSQYFWPESFRINDLAMELLNRGHQVTVLTGIPNYPSGRWFKGYGLKSIGNQYWNGIRIIRTPMFSRKNGNNLQLTLNYMSFAILASLIGPAFCRDKIDLIFVYEPSPFTVGIPGIVMRWLKSAPMMFWVQDLWPESLTATGAVKSNIIIKLISKMVRMIYRRCDRILVQSKAFVKPAIIAGAEMQRIRIFPNWADEFYKPLKLSDSAPELQEIPADFKVIFAGNLGAAQSLETIIEAANRLKNIKEIKWILIGDGRRKEWMKQQVNRKGLANTIHFIERKPSETMPYYFAAADVLLASLRPEPVFSHTIPSKIQTYLACGRPIVSAIDGETARIIRESGCGISVNAGDAEELANAVKQMYLLPNDERVLMGENGRNYYEKHFERTLLLNNLENWMRELMREQK